jgi:Flp pilus assembly protein TadD
MNFLRALIRVGVVATVLLGSAGANAQATSDAPPDLPRWQMLYNQGVAAFNAGQYDSAYANFNAALALEQNSGALYNARGEIFLVARNFPAAVNDFSRALVLDPTNPAYAENLRQARLYSPGTVPGTIIPVPGTIQFPTVRYR